jgi:hypothetical protein
LHRIKYIVRISWGQALEDAAADRAAGIVRAEEERENERVSDHKTRIAHIVERVARDACEDDEDRVDRLYTEACDRLDDDDVYGDVMSRPMSEIVAEVCRDIGLAPDWERLGREAWAQQEMRASAPVSGSDRGRGTPERGGGGVPPPLSLNLRTSFDLEPARPLSPFGTAPPLAGEHARPPPASGAPPPG